MRKATSMDYASDGFSGLPALSLESGNSVIR
jgi:hypothetical protein